MMNDAAPGGAFFICTMGCKVNRYEAQALRESWAARGMKEAARPEDAGTVVVNSCAVTAAAVADLRAAVRRFRRAAPEAEIIVTGCAAGPAGIAELPGASRLVPQRDKAGLLDLFSGNGATGPPGFSANNAAGAPEFSVSSCDRSRAVLKIQDGCSHACAFCIVPSVRGAARSRPPEASIGEALRLLRAGFREIVLSGVNLRAYRETGGRDFWGFLERLEDTLAPDWAGRARLRLSSLEPGQLGDRALAVLGRSRMVAPHLHLSLQSGDPAVLMRMRRGHYEPEALPEFFARLRALWPRFALGADMLTGFPGETDAEFETGLDLIRRLPLTYAHVFPYSRRPGTPAADMPGQVGAGVKKARAARLRAFARERKEAFLRSLLDVPLLYAVFEEGSGDPRTGMCEYYAECLLPDEGAARVRPRVLTPVRPLALRGGRLLTAPAQ
ncbi:MAG: MiaB/RimO family radical SAM methylthiotransferase [Desulfovibrio sp.]|jgi:MiaB/RimO family radical SAM methylthiotransferase|nr:MiaB/RimO family radical SAM methylthiotransferase [Desulfovibrio sp.]